MPLEPNEIKAEIVRRGDTIKGLAFRFSTNKRPFAREDLSRVISGDRHYPELKEKLAAYLGKSVEEVFGAGSQKKAA